ncbi:MAG: hypothetical protein KDD52_09395 [Bdellovibrionales bacterium]|nr:hypothetical protein [Bdellovibrionales bacterium]
MAKKYFSIFLMIQMIACSSADTYAQEIKKQQQGQEKEKKAGEGETQNQEKDKKENKIPIPPVDPRERPDHLDNDDIDVDSHTKESEGKVILPDNIGFNKSNDIFSTEKIGKPKLEKPDSNIDNFLNNFEIKIVFDLNQKGLDKNPDESIKEATESSKNTLEWENDPEPKKLGGLTEDKHPENKNENQVVMGEIRDGRIHMDQESTPLPDRPLEPLNSAQESVDRELDQTIRSVGSAGDMRQDLKIESVINERIEVQYSLGKHSNDSSTDLSHLSELQALKQLRDHPWAEGYQNHRVIPEKSYNQLHLAAKKLYVEKVLKKRQAKIDLIRKSLPSFERQTKDQGLDPYKRDYFQKLSAIRPETVQKAHRAFSTLMISAQEKLNSPLPEFAIDFDLNAAQEKIIESYGRRQLQNLFPDLSKLRTQDLTLLRNTFAQWDYAAQLLDDKGFDEERNQVLQKLSDAERFSSWSGLGSSTEDLWEALNQMERSGIEKLLDVIEQSIGNFPSSRFDTPSDLQHVQNILESAFRDLDEGNVYLCGQKLLDLNHQLNQDLGPYETLFGPEDLFFMGAAGITRGFSKTLARPRVFKANIPMRYKDYGIQTATEHILAKHSFHTAPKKSSKFLSEFGEKEILDLVKTGIANGKPTPSGFIHTFDKVIGFNKDGIKTKTLYIYTKPNGILRTAFPK